MVRTNMSITEEQHEWLQERAEESGLSMAEVIRRALDSYQTVHESDLDPDDPRAKYVQFAGEHMAEMVAAVLEGLGSQEVRELLRKAHDESQEREQPTED